MEQNKKETLYRYWFSQLPGLGRGVKRRIQKNFSEKELFEMEAKQWKEILSVREWNSLCRHQKDSGYDRKYFTNNIEEIEKEYEGLRKKGILFLHEKDEAYPFRLKQIEDNPLGIFVKGNLPKGKKALAIVGSRVPSVYGREMARIFARELAKEGIDIISGLAAGVDVEAHIGALEGNGFTLGVLGCGVDIVYPRENFDVYQKIAERGGILSEYKPKEAPLSYRFP